MMAQQVDEIARGWLARIPERVRDACRPEVAMKTLHGVECGVWACPSCERVYQLDDYPSSGCPGCGRPLPSRCMYRDEDDKQCDGFAQPERTDLGWYGPGEFCAECVDRRAKRRRADEIQKRFPEKELRQLREGYQRHDHRAALDRALEAWVASSCGRDDGKPWVIAWGGTGSGKTIALLYHAAAAYHGRGLVDSILYVTEEELTRAASLEWSQDDDEKAEARKLIRHCLDVDLLILDELGASAKLTDAQYKCYTRILKLRIDAAAPTLIAMNRNLEGDEKGRPLAWLDIRVDSRVEQLAAVVACTGVDLRRD